MTAPTHSHQHVEILTQNVMDHVRVEYEMIQRIAAGATCKGCDVALPYDFAHALRQVADEIDGGWEDYDHWDDDFTYLPHMAWNRKFPKKKWER